MIMCLGCLARLEWARRAFEFNDFKIPPKFFVRCSTNFLDNDDVVKTCLDYFIERLDDLSRRHFGDTMKKLSGDTDGTRTRNLPIDSREL